MLRKLATAANLLNGGPCVAATQVNGSLLGPTTIYPGSTAPAKSGETVVLYANGVGSLSPVPLIKIGGVTATVSFAGLVAPGQYQCNVVVPLNRASGNQPITAAYSGQTTHVGTSITIQN